MLSVIAAVFKTQSWFGENYSPMGGKGFLSLSTVTKNFEYVQNVIYLWLRAKNKAHHPPLVKPAATQVLNRALYFRIALHE